MRAKSLLLSLVLFVAAPAVSAADSLVEAALLSQLRMGYRTLCEECRIEFKDVKFPQFAREDLAQVRINFQNLKWNGSFLLPIDFLGQTQAYISGQVRIYKKGLVTKQAVASLQNLTEEAVVDEWIDVTFSKDRLASLSDLKNVVAARPLQIRQAILLSDLRKPELVKRGQSVKVSYGNELFEVTTQMRAEESGVEGDSIKLKSFDTNKVFNAKITETGAARIE